MSTPRSRPPRASVLARVALALIPALPVAGCGGGDEAPDSAVVVDTLASGVVRVRSAGPPPRVDTLPLILELGSRDGPVRWGRIGGVELAPGGRVLVLDELAHRVRIFDEGGRLLSAFGREGEGPRELLTPLGVLRDGGGRIWVPDSRNARYTVFDTTGTLLETRPRPVRYHDRWRGAFLDDGRLLEGAYVRSTVREEFVVPGFVVGFPDRPDRDTIRIPWHGLPSFERPKRTRPGSATLTPGLPFAPRLEATPDPRGFVWEGHAAAYRVARLDLTGDTVGLVERVTEPLPVLDQEADSVLDELRRQFPSWRRVLRRSALPEQHPWFTDLRAGEAGTLWVRRPHRGAGTVFDVFDAGGALCRSAVLPVTLDDEHTALGWGRLAGVTEDALGVERVVVARVGPPCGG